jgi:hypothetical protein
MMKKLLAGFAAVMLALMPGASAAAASQEGAVTVTADSDAAAGLDLHAVAELFKDSENLEKFERALNNSDTGVNNLDVNGDGQVDFIRVTEKSAGDTRLVVLQAVLGEDDFQDVATIAVEREGAGYNLHVQGEATIYGESVYVVPASRDFGAWNVVRWLFRPDYRPYVSFYTYRTLPAWWVARRPVAVAAYRARTTVFVGRRNFVASRTFTVKTVNRIAYHSRASALVVRRAPAPRVTTNVLRPGPGPVVRTHTETTVRPGGATRTTTTVVRGGGGHRGKH